MRENKRFQLVLDSTFFFLSTDAFRDQALFLMKETSNGYMDILNMPTDLRIKLTLAILDMKKLEKQQLDDMKADLSIQHKRKN